MTTFAAVDLGAQSGRVAVGDFDGDRLETTEVHRFANVPVRLGETLHWDILGLYREVLDGLRAAARRGAPVASIGVDSWAIDFGLVDRAGRLLRNPVHYRDGRRARAVDSVLERISARELYDRTGIQLLPINTIFELAAMAGEPDPVLDTADSMLLIPDLMHSWLCGARTSERTNASTTQCFDPRTRGWACDLVERLDVPGRLLPELVDPGTRLGRLEAAVADETHLGETNVVAVATHDTGSAVAAVPFRRPHSVFVSVGTWSLVGLEVDEPMITEASFAANITNEGGVGETVRLLRNVTGLWLLHECRRAWADEGTDYAFDELIALAREAPAFTAFLDPNDPAFLEPGDMPTRIRAYCTATGQTPPAEAGATARCILESLALKHAETIETLAAVTGTEPAEIHVVGGGARNELLCEWTACASGLPVLAGPDEATVLGNLLVQAMAAGEISSLAEGREVVRRSVELSLHEPDERPEWAEARARFAAITARRSLEISA
jgi:rhamnulokinase